MVEEITFRDIFLVEYSGPKSIKYNIWWIDSYKQNCYEIFYLKNTRDVTFVYPETQII